jgi:hypothetical protein
MSRILAGTVTVNGTDDENWPESDEEVHRVFTVEAVLDEGQPAQSFDIPDVRWGGECRVELRLTAREVGSGAVQLEGQARLYEGDSEDTSDLEEEQTVTMTVPRGGRPAHSRVQLSNSGLGGGDHAEIGLSFTNSLYEG